MNVAGKSHKNIGQQQHVRRVVANLGQVHAFILNVMLAASRGRQKQPSMDCHFGQNDTQVSRYIGGVFSLLDRWHCRCSIVGAA